MHICPCCTKQSPCAIKPGVLTLIVGFLIFVLSFNLDLNIQLSISVLTDSIFEYFLLFVKTPVLRHYTFINKFHFCTDKSDRGKKGKQHVVVEAEVEEEEHKSVWVTTLPNGDRMQYKDNTAEELKPIMICLASDPETNQVSSW